MIQQVTPPHIKKIKEIIEEWLKHNPRITKVYLFGSYVKKNKPSISDIDVAIEISGKTMDTAFGFWCSQADRMRKELNNLLNYKVDLWRFAGEETLTIKKGLDEGSILIYPCPSE